MIQEMSIENFTRSTIFVKWGPGLGASLYINEGIVNGANSKAGEIGKIIVNDKNGNNTTLEEILNLKEIVNEIVTNFNKSTMPILSSKINSKEDIDIDIIVDVLNTDGVDYVKKIVLNKVNILLEYLYIVDSVLDLKNIILYGRIFEQDKFFNNIIEFTKKEFPKLDKKIKKSKLYKENEYYASIYLVMSNIFS